MDVLVVVIGVALIVLWAGVIIGSAIHVGGQDEVESAKVQRRRRELEAAAGRRRISIVREFLPNDGDDGDAA